MAKYTLESAIAKLKADLTTHRDTLADLIASSPFKVSNQKTADQLKTLPLSYIVDYFTDPGNDCFSPIQPYDYYLEENGINFTGDCRDIVKTEDGTYYGVFSRSTILKSTDLDHWFRVTNFGLEEQSSYFLGELPKILNELDGTSNFDYSISMMLEHLWYIDGVFVLVYVSAPSRDVDPANILNNNTPVGQLVYATDNLEDLSRWKLVSMGVVDNQVYHYQIKGDYVVDYATDHHGKIALLMSNGKILSSSNHFENVIVTNVCLPDKIQEDGFPKTATEWMNDNTKMKFQGNRWDINTDKYLTGEHITANAIAYYRCADKDTEEIEVGNGHNNVMKAKIQRNTTDNGVWVIGGTKAFFAYSYDLVEWAENPSIEDSLRKAYATKRARSGFGANHGFTNTTTDCLVRFGLPAYLGGRGFSITSFAKPPKDASLMNGGLWLTLGTEETYCELLGLGKYMYPETFSNIHLVAAGVPIVVNGYMGKTNNNKFHENIMTDRYLANPAESSLQPEGRYLVNGIDFLHLTTFTDIEYTELIRFNLNNKSAVNPGEFFITITQLDLHNSSGIPASRAMYARRRPTPLVWHYRDERLLPIRKYAGTTETGNAQSVAALITDMSKIGHQQVIVPIIGRILAFADSIIETALENVYIGQFNPQIYSSDIRGKDYLYTEKISFYQSVPDGGTITYPTNVSNLAYAYTKNGLLYDKWNPVMTADTENLNYANVNKTNIWNYKESIELLNINAATIIDDEVIITMPHAILKANIAQDGSFEVDKIYTTSSLTTMGTTETTSMDHDRSMVVKYLPQAATYVAFPKYPVYGWFAHFFYSEDGKKWKKFEIVSSKVGVSGPADIFTTETGIGTADTNTDAVKFTVFPDSAGNAGIGLDTLQLTEGAMRIRDIDAVRCVNRRVSIYVFFAGPALAVIPLNHTFDWPSKWESAPDLRIVTNAALQRCVDAAATGFNKDLYRPYQFIYEPVHLEMMEDRPTTVDGQWLIVANEHAPLASIQASCGNGKPEVIIKPCYIDNDCTGAASSMHLFGLNNMELYKQVSGSSWVTTTSENPLRSGVLQKSPLFMLHNIHFRHGLRHYVGYHGAYLGGSTGQTVVNAYATNALVDTSLLFNPNADFVLPSSGEYTDFATAPLLFGGSPTGTVSNPMSHYVIYPRDKYTAFNIYCLRTEVTSSYDAYTMAYHFADYGYAPFTFHTIDPDASVDNIVASTTSEIKNIVPIFGYPIWRFSRKRYYEMPTSVIPEENQLDVYVNDNVSNVNDAGFAFGSILSYIPSEPYGPYSVTVVNGKAVVSSLFDSADLYGRFEHDRIGIVNNKGHYYVNFNKFKGNNTVIANNGAVLKEIFNYNIPQYPAAVDISDIPSSTNNDLIRVMDHDGVTLFNYIDRIRIRNYRRFKIDLSAPPTPDPGVDTRHVYEDGVQYLSSEVTINRDATFGVGNNPNYPNRATLMRENGELFYSTPDGLLSKVDLIKPADLDDIGVNHCVLDVESNEVKYGSKRETEPKGHWNRLFNSDMNHPYIGSHFKSNTDFATPLLSDTNFNDIQKNLIRNNLNKFPVIRTWNDMVFVISGGKVRYASTKFANGWLDDPYHYIEPKFADGSSAYVLDIGWIQTRRTRNLNGKESERVPSDCSYALIVLTIVKTTGTDHQNAVFGAHVIPITPYSNLMGQSLTLTSKKVYEYLTTIPVLPDEWYRSNYYSAQSRYSMVYDAEVHSFPDRKIPLKIVFTNESTDKELATPDEQNPDWFLHPIVISEHFIVDFSEDILSKDSIKININSVGYTADPGTHTIGVMGKGAHRCPKYIDIPNSKDGVLVTPFGEGSVGLMDTTLATSSIAIETFPNSLTIDKGGGYRNPYGITHYQVKIGNVTDDIWNKIKKNFNSKDMDKLVQVRNVSNINPKGECIIIFAYAINDAPSSINKSKYYTQTHRVYLGKYVVQPKAATDIDTPYGTYEKYDFIGIGAIEIDHLDITSIQWYNNEWVATALKSPLTNDLYGSTYKASEKLGPDDQVYYPDNSQISTVILNNRTMLHVAYSKDGLHWGEFYPLNIEPVITYDKVSAMYNLPYLVADNDRGNLFMYDGFGSVYIKSLSTKFALENNVILEDQVNIYGRARVAKVPRYAKNASGVLTGPNRFEPRIEIVLDAIYPEYMFADNFQFVDISGNLGIGSTSFANQTRSRLSTNIGALEYWGVMFLDFTSFMYAAFDTINLGSFDMLTREEFRPMEIDYNYTGRIGGIWGSQRKIYTAVASELVTYRDRKNLSGSKFESSSMALLRSYPYNYLDYDYPITLSIDEYANMENFPNLYMTQTADGLAPKGRVAFIEQYPMPFLYTQDNCDVVLTNMDPIQRLMDNIKTPWYNRNQPMMYSWLAFMNMDYKNSVTLYSGHNSFCIYFPIVNKVWLSIDATTWLQYVENAPMKNNTISNENWENLFNYDTFDMDFGYTIIGRKMRVLQEPECQDYDLYPLDDF